jgi:hypothetical protein
VQKRTAYHEQGENCNGRQATPHSHFARVVDSTIFLYGFLPINESSVCLLEETPLELFGITKQNDKE